LGVYGTEYLDNKIKRIWEKRRRIYFFVCLFV
jgi:hypothetical protein